MNRLSLNLCILFLIFANLGKAQTSEKKIVWARLESCPGCSLNRLPDVKRFVYDDFEHYENTNWVKVNGAPPVLYFLDENDQVVSKHALGDFNRNECNKLMEDHGFTRKKEQNEL